MITLKTVDLSYPTPPHTFLVLAYEEDTKGFKTYCNLMGYTDVFTHTGLGDENANNPNTWKSFNRMYISTSWPIYNYIQEYNSIMSDNDNNIRCEGTGSSNSSIS